MKRPITIHSDSDHEDRATILFPDEALLLPIEGFLKVTRSFLIGKTDTINDRRVEVDLDGVDQKEWWTEYRKDAAVSLPNFVRERVEYTCDQGGSGFISGGDWVEQLQEREAEITKYPGWIEKKNNGIGKLRPGIAE